MATGQASPKTGKVVDIPANAPTIGTATAGTGSVSVAFTAPSTSVGGPVFYYTTISSPDSVTVTGTTSPINVTGLTNGTPYTFVVAGGNPTGLGPYSAASNSATPIDVNNWIAILDSTGADGVSQVNTARLLDSSGNIYWAGIKSVSGVNGWWVIKYDSTGTIVWANQITFSGFNVQGPWLDVDSSNNLYIIAYGGSSPEKTLILKLNSSGGVSFCKTFNHSSINSSAVHASIRASNGNIGLPFYENAAALITGAGSVSWSNRVTTGAAIPLFNGAFVSSNNDLYLSALRPNSAQNYYQAGLYKLNNGSFGWQRWFTYGTDSAYGYLRAMDSSENLYIVGFYSPSYSGNQGILMKVNSSGNLVWQRALQRYTSGIALDASDNIYVATYGPSTTPNGASSAFALHKYNSSGTVQWQRTIDLGVGTDISIPNSMSVSADNAYIHFTTTYTKDSVSYPISFRLPTDGSKTGSYSIKGMTLSYQTVSMTSITGGLTQTTISDSAGSNSINAADVTQTVTSISPTNTKVVL
jgi:hypothetical protein